MCGIFAYLNGNVNEGRLKDMSDFASKRGPEHSTFVKVGDTVYLGFHRLAINGLNEVSHQPITRNHLSLICNGEIYNHAELSKKYKLATQSDCEIILHLYEQYGVESFKMLDGEFSFILYDDFKKEVIVVRDPYGVRPLYENLSETGYYFSSVLEGVMTDDTTKIKQVRPGTYTIYQYDGESFSKYLSAYYFNIRDVYELSCSKEIYMKHLYNTLKWSVIKRVSTSDRPVCCLLSGGLDSSLVCAITSKYFKSIGKQLHTFSIGMKGSEDLYYADIAAKHIDSIHHEVICSEEEFIGAIPSVIKDIESYDTTTVRASVGNWLIGKYIKEHTEFKVVLNGDGADELMGGYLYFNSCGSNDEFDEECYRLLENIHYFDVLRSDRSISSHGLESRTPFLDKQLTKFYMSIPTELRKTVTEKAFIRNAVEMYDPELLPSRILWRQKEAFSDGVSSLHKGWYSIIKDNLSDYVPKTEDSWYNIRTKEQSFYLDIFRSHFPGCTHLIPYYWMPRFVNTTDPSARTIGLRGNIIYKYFDILKHLFTGVIMYRFRKFFL